jgi:protein SCO1/2
MLFAFQVDENENDDAEYLVDHSIVLYLVSPEGQFLDFFTQRMEVGEVVERLDKCMKEYGETIETAEKQEKEKTGILAAVGKFTAEQKRSQ